MVSLKQNTSRILLLFIGHLTAFERKHNNIKILIEGA